MRRTVLLCALALAIGACGIGVGASDFDGAWQLVEGRHSGSAIPLLDSHPLTMTLDGESIGGTAACNSYGGTYRLDITGRFSIPEGLAQTEMACMPQEVMDAERLFLSALSSVDRIARDGDRLQLTGPGTEMTFEILPPVPTADLLGTEWVLDGLVSGDAVTSVMGARATLVLDPDGTLTGSTGCRTIRGSYVITGAEIQITNLGAEGECGSELQRQDSAVISALEGGFRVEIDGNRMTTWSAGDEGLTFIAAS